MVAFGSSDVLWYIIAAVAAGFALTFVAGVRRFFRWCGRKLKAGYLDWFAEAVDAHVEPKFVQLRDETEATIAPIASTLHERTDMFERLEQTLTDTQLVLNEHMAKDDAVMAAAGEALQVGQQELLAKIAEQHQDTLDRFASLETSVKKNGNGK